MTAAPPAISNNEETPAFAPRPAHSRPYPAAAEVVRKAFAMAVGATAVVTILWAVLQLPIDVPDTNSPPAGTSTGEANDWNSVGQTFVARRNNLNRVSVVLATDRHTDNAQIAFHIKEVPKGEPLRTVKRTISLLPEGDPMRFLPGTISEQWVTFEFDPVPDSAGRKLYFSIEGKDVPRENSVRVLMFYHNKYPFGEAYRNESEVGAHLVFRAYSSGRVEDLATVLVETLTRGRPGILKSPILYATVVAAYLLLAGKVLGKVISSWTTTDNIQSSRG